MNYSLLSQYLSSGQPENVLKAVTDIKDRMDFTNMPMEFGNFVSQLFPTLRDLIFNNTPIQFEDNTENKIRNYILDIFHHFPMNHESLRMIALDLIAISLRVINDDNEDNAILASKIFFDIHKTYRPNLESQVQSFLDTALRTYKNMPQMVKVHIPPATSIPSITASSSILIPGPTGGTQPPAAAAAAAAANLKSIAGSSGGSALSSVGQHDGDKGSNALSNKSSSSTALTKGLDSFKFLGECPVMLMFFMQVYPKSCQRILPSIIQHILAFLELGSNQSTNTQISNSAKEKFKDLVYAQVKSLTFVSYIIRAHSDFMRQHEQTIVRNLHSLVVRCPDDSQVIRKDLLISLKALVSSDLKKALFLYMSDIMDEQFLLGPGGHIRQPYLRPLAYSTMVDFIYQSKEMLNIGQLTRVIHMFCVNIHDPTLQISIQTASVRLLLSLVEIVGQHPLEYIETSHYLLMHIFGSFVGKLGTLMERDSMLSQSQGTGGSSSSGSGSGGSANNPVNGNVKKSVNLSPWHRTRHDKKQIQQYNATETTQYVNSEEAFRSLLARQCTELKSLSKFSSATTSDGMDVDSDDIEIVDESIFKIVGGNFDDMIFSFPPTSFSSLPEHQSTSKATDEKLDAILKSNNPCNLQLIPDSMFLADTIFPVNVYSQKDIKGLVRVILYGLKSIVVTVLNLRSLVSTINNPNLTKPSATGSSSTLGFGTPEERQSRYDAVCSTLLTTYEDKKLLAKMFEAGYTCVMIFLNISPLSDPLHSSAVTVTDDSANNGTNLNATNGNKPLSAAVSISREEGDISGGLVASATELNEVNESIEHLTSILGSLDTALAKELFSQFLPTLFDLALIKNGYVSFTTILNQLTSSGVHASSFLDVLLSYLHSRLSDLSSVVVPFASEGDLSYHVNRNINIETAMKKKIFHYKHDDDNNYKDNSAQSEEQQYVDSLLEEEENSQSDTQLMQTVEKSYHISTLILQLFKIAFTFTKGHENEKVIRVRFVGLVLSCLQYAYCSRMSANYYTLLRIIFKSISSSKHELCYHVFSAAVPTVLNGLHSLYGLTSNEVTRAIIIELMLSIPARWSTLVPTVPVLFPYVVIGINIKCDLAGLPLRALEYWMDASNPYEFSSVLEKYPALSHDLFEAISRHLKPQPHPFGTIALKLLGKMGAHTHNFVKRFAPSASSGTNTTGFDSENDLQQVGYSLLPYLNSSSSPEAAVMAKRSDRMEVEGSVESHASLTAAATAAAEEEEGDKDVCRLSDLIDSSTVLDAACDVIQAVRESATSACTIEKLSLYLDSKTSYTLKTQMMILPDFLDEQTCPNSLVDIFDIAQANSDNNKDSNVPNLTAPSVDNLPATVTTPQYVTAKKQLDRNVATMFLAIDMSKISLDLKPVHADTVYISNVTFAKISKNALQVIVRAIKVFLNDNNSTTGGESPASTSNSASASREPSQTADEVKMIVQQSTDYDVTNSSQQSKLLTSATVLKRKYPQDLERLIFTLVLASCDPKLESTCKAQLIEVCTKFLLQSDSSSYNGFEIIHKVILKSFADYVPQVFIAAVWLLKRWLFLLFTVDQSQSPTQAQSQTHESPHTDRSSHQHSSRVMLILNDVAQRCVLSCSCTSNAVDCMAGLRMINELCNFYIHHEYARDRSKAQEDGGGTADSSMDEATAFAAMPPNIANFTQQMLVKWDNAYDAQLVESVLNVCRSPSPAFNSIDLSDNLPVVLSKIISVCYVSKSNNSSSPLHPATPAATVTADTPKEATSSSAAATAAATATSAASAISVVNSSSLTTSEAAVACPVTSSLSPPGAGEASSPVEGNQDDLKPQSENETLNTARNATSTANLETPVTASTGHFVATISIFPVYLLEKFCCGLFHENSMMRNICLRSVNFVCSKRLIPNVSKIPEAMLLCKSRLVEFTYRDIGHISSFASQALSSSPSLSAMDQQVSESSSKGTASATSNVAISDDSKRKVSYNVWHPGISNGLSYCLSAKPLIFSVDAQIWNFFMHSVEFIENDVASYESTCTASFEYTLMNEYYRSYCNEALSNFIPSDCMFPFVGPIRHHIDKLRAWVILFRAIMYNQMQHVFRDDEPIAFTVPYEKYDNIFERSARLLFLVILRYTCKTLTREAKNTLHIFFEFSTYLSNWYVKRNSQSSKNNNNVDKDGASLLVGAKDSAAIDAPTTPYRSLMEVVQVQMKGFINYLSDYQQLSAHYLIALATVQCNLIVDNTRASSLTAIMIHDKVYELLKFYSDVDSFSKLQSVSTNPTGQEMSLVTSLLKFFVTFPKTGAVAAIHDQQQYFQNGGNTSNVATLTTQQHVIRYFQDLIAYTLRYESPFRYNFNGNLYRRNGSLIPVVVEYIQSFSSICVYFLFSPAQMCRVDISELLKLICTSDDPQNLRFLDDMSQTRHLKLLLDSILTPGLTIDYDSENVSSVLGAGYGKKTTHQGDVGVTAAASVNVNDLNSEVSVGTGAGAGTHFRHHYENNKLSRAKQPHASHSSFSDLLKSQSSTSGALPGLDASQPFGNLGGSYLSGDAQGAQTAAASVASSSASLGSLLHQPSASGNSAPVYSMYGMSESEFRVAINNSFYFVKRLVTRRPSLLSTEPELFSLIRHYFKLTYKFCASSINSIIFLGFPASTVIKQQLRLKMLVQLLLLTPATHPEHIDAIFDLLYVLTMSKSNIDYTFVNIAIRTALTQATMAQKKSFFVRGFQAMSDPGGLTEWKIKVVHVICNPILLDVFTSTAASAPMPLDFLQSSTPRLAAFSPRDKDPANAAPSSAPSSGQEPSSSVPTPTHSSGVKSAREEFLDPTIVNMIYYEIVEKQYITIQQQKQQQQKQQSNGGLSSKSTNTNTVSNEEASSLCGGKDNNNLNAAAAAGISALNFDHLLNLSTTMKIARVKILALILTYASNLFVMTKKREMKLMECAWNSYSKAEDSQLKHWGAFTLCRLFSDFESHPKLVMNVYVNLIRVFPTDGKEVAKAAIDSLLPVLQARLSTGQDKFTFSKAWSWTKRILAEESGNVQNLIFILQTISRFPDVFYAYKHQLISQMTSSIARIGFSPHSTLDHRIVALNIIDVIISWEWFRRKRLCFKRASSTTSTSITLSNESINNTSSNQSDDGNDSVVPTTDGGPQPQQQPIQPTSGLVCIIPIREKEHEKILHISQIHLIANFVVRLSLFAIEHKDSSINRLLPKCVELFQKLTRVFSFENIKLSYLEKFLHIGVNASNATTAVTWDTREQAVCTYLEICLCSFYMLDEPHHLLMQCLAQGGSIVIESVYQSASHKAHLLFRQFVKKLMQLYSPADHHLNYPKEFRDLNFYNTLKEVVESHTKVSETHGSSLTAAGTIEMKNLLFTLALISDVGEAHPQWIDNHGSLLIKVCAAMTSDHITKAVKSSSKSTDAAFSVTYSNELGADWSTLPSHCLPLCNIFKDFSTPFHILNYNQNYSSLYTRSFISTDHMTAIYLCIVILFKALESRLSIAYLKRKVVPILINIIDGSDCPLLLNLVGQIGEAWLLRPGSPLDFEEQYMLYSKVSSNIDRDLREKVSIVDGINHSFSIRFAYMADRVGGFFDSQPELFARRFDSTTTGLSGTSPLGAICLLSPNAAIRRNAQLRVFNAFGKTLYDRLLSFFLFDWSHISNRYFVMLLPSLFFELMVTGVSRNDATAQGVIEPRNELTTNHFSLTDFDCLSDLSMIHGGLSEHITQAFFSRIWTSITESMRITLVEAVQNFILKLKPKKVLYNLPDGGSRDDGQLARNIPQFLVHIMTNLEPKPQFSMDFLATMSHTYGLVPEVLDLLESTLFSCDVAIPSVACIGDKDKPIITAADNSSTGGLFTLQSLTEIAGSKDTDSSHVPKRRIYNLYMHLLEEIHEKDQIIALYRMRAQHPSSTLGLSFEAYDRQEEAQLVYVNAIKSNLTSSTRATAAVSLLPSSSQTALNTPDVNTFELQLWENRWIETCRELSQWPMLSEFAQNQSLSSLMFESALMQCDRDCLKRLRSHPAIVATCERGILTAKFADIMFSIIDNKMTEVERHCAQSVQLALNQWQIFPGLASSSPGHKLLLSTFQRIMELRESAGVSDTVLKSSKEKKLPDIKTTLKNWRNRILNRFLCMSSLNSLLEWRLSIFTAIQNAYPNHDPTQIAAVHDTPWTTLYMSKLARKRAYYELSLNYLERLRNTMSMDITDAFTKIREQILWFMSPVCNDPLGAINLINSSNIDFFNASQKSELFRLKGVSFRRFGNNYLREAMESLASSVQMAPNNSRAWLSWSHACYAQYNSYYDKSKPFMWSLHGQKSENNAYTEKIEAAKSVIASLLKAAEFESQPAHLLLNRVVWLLVTTAAENIALQSLVHRIQYRDTSRDKADTKDSARSKNEFEGRNHPNSSAVNEYDPLSELLQVVAKYGSTLPSWRWLCVFKDLLFHFEGLQLSETHFGYLLPIMAKVAIAHPNAVVFDLLAMAAASADRSKKSMNFSSTSSPSSKSKTASPSAFVTGKGDSNGGSRDKTDNSVAESPYLSIRILNDMAAKGDMTELIMSAKHFCNSLQELTAMSELEVKLAGYVCLCGEIVYNESLVMEDLLSALILNYIISNDLLNISLPLLTSSGREISCVRELTQRIGSQLKKLHSAIDMNKRTSMITYGDLFDISQDVIAALCAYLNESKLGQSHSLTHCSAQEAISESAYHQSEVSHFFGSSKDLGICGQCDCASLCVDPTESRTNDKLVGFKLSKLWDLIPHASCLPFTSTLLKPPVVTYQLKLFSENGRVYDVNYERTVHSLVPMSGASSHPQQSFFLSKYQNRSTNISGMLNWAFDQHHAARKRDLHMYSYPLLVPILDDGMLVNKSEGMTTLYDLHSRRHAQSGDFSTACFTFLVQGGLWKTRKLSSSTGQKGKSQVYEVMAPATPNSLVKDFFSASSASSSQLYACRRLFALQLGTQFALQLMLSNSATPPHHFYVSRAGHASLRLSEPVYSTDTLMKLRSGVASYKTFLKSASAGVKAESSVSNSGHNPWSLINEVMDKLQLVLDKAIAANQRELHDLDTNTNKAIPPFRLTQNVASALSRPLLLGATATALGCTLDAISANLDIFESELCLYYSRDLQTIVKELMRNESSHADSSSTSAITEADTTQTILSCVVPPIARLVALDALDRVRVLAPSHPGKIYPEEQNEIQQQQRQDDSGVTQLSKHLSALSQHEWDSQPLPSLPASKVAVVTAPPAQATGKKTVSPDRGALAAGAAPVVSIAQPPAAAVDADLVELLERSMSDASLQRAKLNWLPWL